MKWLINRTQKSVFTCVIILIAVLEFVLLVRHDVIKNILINRGILKKEVTERPDYHCLLGWENTLGKMDYKADVCFFGNSITFHSNFQKDYPNLKIVNLGYSGDNIEGMLIRYKQIASVKPNKIFLMAGFNDLRNPRVTIEKFRESYKQLLDSIRISNPNANIYLENILPINHQMNSKLYPTERIMEANSVVKELAMQYSLVYIDLFSMYADKNNELPAELTTDGVHLKPDSYRIWSNAIHQYLNK